MINFPYNLFNCDPGLCQCQTFSPRVYDSAFAHFQGSRSSIYFQSGLKFFIKFLLFSFERVQMNAHTLHAVLIVHYIPNQMKYMSMFCFELYLLKISNIWTKIDHCCLMLLLFFYFIWKSVVWVSLYYLIFFWFNWMYSRDNSSSILTLVFDRRLNTFLTFLRRRAVSVNLKNFV